MHSHSIHGPGHFKAALARAAASHPGPGAGRVVDARAGFNRRDPTGTLTLRRAFAADISKRFALLRRLAHQFLVEGDLLGLGPQPTVGSVQHSGSAAQRIEVAHRWLGNALLTMVVAHDGHWVEPYIRAAYTKGVRDAARRAHAQAKVREDQVATLTRLTIIELRGIAAEVERQVSRRVSAVITTSGPPAMVMMEVRDRLDKIGLVRARALVNTSVVQAHAQGSLDAYAQAGVGQVGLLPEHVPVVGLLRDARPPRTLIGILTAGDDLVCQVCEDLEAGGPYSLAEAIGLIPAHPNCRCAWVPWEGPEEE